MFSARTPRTRLKTPVGDTPLSSRKKELYTNVVGDSGRSFPASLESISTPVKLGEIQAKQQHSSLSSMAVPHQMQFIKSQVLSLVQVSSIPVEIDSFLNSLNFEIDDTRALVDPNSGYCVIASQSHCFVWAGYKKLSIGYSFIQELAIPEHESSFLRAPLIAIVPSAMSEDPKQAGLLMVTHDGHVRFWENLEYGSEHYIDRQLEIANDETVVDLIACEPIGFTVATCHAALYKINLFDEDAKPVLSFLQVAESKGLFGFSQSAVRPRKADNDFVSVCASYSADKRATRDVYLLTKTRLEKWNLQKSQGDKLLFAVDINELIQAKLESELEKSSFTFGIDSVKATKDRKMACLVTFTLDDVTHYNCIMLINIETATQFSVLDIFHLKVRANVSSSDDQTDRHELILCNGGPLAIVVFRNGLVLRLLESESHFEQGIAFKTSLEKKFLCVNSFDNRSFSSLADSSCEFVCLLANSGVLAGQLNLTKARSTRTPGMDSGTLDDRTDEIAQVIEQAVTFGMSDRVSNPVLFDLGHLEGNYDQAVLALSNTILESLPSTLMTSMYQLLTERFKKIDKIIKFLKEQNRQLSDTCSTMLMYNAERAVAAADLWSVYEQEMSKSPSFSLLLKKRIARALGHAQPSASMGMSMVVSDESVQQFFAQHAQSIARLVLLSTTDQIDINSVNDVNYVCESAVLLLSIVGSSRDYRYKNCLQLYNVDAEHLVVEPWDCTLELINAIEKQMEQTAKSIEFLQKSTVNDFAHVKEQFVGLADILLGSFKGLLGFSERKSMPQTFALLKERYTSTYPNILYTVDKYAGKHCAVELCEKYKIFDVLVEFSLQESTETLFMEKYGMYKRLLDQDSVWDNLIDEWLQQSSPLNEGKEGNVRNFKWIHDLKLGHYDQAFDCLMKVAQSEKDFEKKNLFLNLSRACYWMQIDVAQIDEDAQVVDDLSYFQRETDYISIHEITKNRFKDTGDVQLILENFYADQVSNPAYKSLENSLKLLLSNKLLSLDAFVDLLTLSKESEWFEDAIEVCLMMLEQDQQMMNWMMKRVWRRGIVHTRWTTLLQQAQAYTGAQVQNELKNTAVYHLIKRTKQLDKENTIPQPTLILAEYSQTLSASEALSTCQALSALNTQSIGTHTAHQTSQQISGLPVTPQDVLEINLLKELCSNQPLDQIVQECVQLYFVESNLQ